MLFNLDFKELSPTVFPMAGVGCDILIITANGGCFSGVVVGGDDGIFIDWNEYLGIVENGRLQIQPMFEGSIFAVLDDVVAHQVAKDAPADGDRNQIDLDEARKDGWA